jgi:AAA15 family ATPase/GTPase
MDIKTPPEIYAQQVDGDERWLRLNMAYVFDEQSLSTQANGLNGALPMSETKTFMNTLEMQFGIRSKGETKTYQSSITVRPDGMVSNKKMNENYLEKYQTAYLTADLWGINLAATLSELFKRKQKDLIVERLANFDKNINTIDILNNDVYIGFEGINEMLPLGMSGDGLRRFLNIVASSANPMTNVILIDEIDNGLHYSAYKKLWEAIFALATTTNKQVFVTTHSKETLYKLNEMLEENPSYQEEMRLYTIENTKLKGHQAYKLTYDGLYEACTNDIELRSIVL